MAGAGAREEGAEAWTQSVQLLPQHRPGEPMTDVWGTLLLYSGDFGCLLCMIRCLLVFLTDSIGFYPINFSLPTVLSCR